MTKVERRELCGKEKCPKFKKTEKSRFMELIFTALKQTVHILSIDLPTTETKYDTENLANFVRPKDRVFMGRDIEFSLEAIRNFLKVTC
jgi:hypothetical protein